jgi:translation initiation factor 3 subunit E
MYQDTDGMLSNLLAVSQPSSGNYLGALWGRLACHILQAKWEETQSDYITMKDAIEQRGIAPMDQIRHRAWLLHWSLFVHSNKQDGMSSLADLFSEKHYLATMENLCPWLLRYYTAAVILSPNRRGDSLSNIVNEIQSLNYLYSDPITQFLESLYTQFDFDEAQKKLVECQELIKHDFFLQSHLERFSHEARVLICDMYCSINRTVDLKMLATKLQLNEEEAEKWMVQMVRGNDSLSNARIDSSAKQVLMGMNNKNVQQQIIERTGELTHRSAAMGGVLETVLNKERDFLRARSS